MYIYTTYNGETYNLIINALLTVINILKSSYILEVVYDGFKLCSSKWFVLQSYRRMDNFLSCNVCKMINAFEVVSLLKNDNDVLKCRG